MKRKSSHQTPRDVFENTKTDNISLLSHYASSAFLIKKPSKMNLRLHTPTKAIFLAMTIFLMGYSSVVYSQAAPVITIRFANPHYDCLNEQYCVDVEYLSDTPGQQLFGTNVRFFYPDDLLELVAFTDYQGGYGAVAPDPPTVLNSPFAGPALFNFVGSADFVNGAIQLVNPFAPPIILSTVTWTKIFSICFTVDDPNVNINSFCPSLVWDLEQNPANGGFLAGDDGVVITLTDPTMMMESVPADEAVVQFNWVYSGPGTPPYGMPVQTICTSLDCSPTIFCAADITVNCNESTVPPNTGVATATDICQGEPTITFSDMVQVGNCPNNFVITRTWVAVNACDLSDECTQSVTVRDIAPPSIMCPANTTVQCANQVPPPDPATATASDNCTGIPTVTFVSDVTSNQTCANRFLLTRTYRATDACGNSATCSHTITVFDNIPPPITCPSDATVQCASQVPGPNGPTAGATDNCGGVSTVTFVNDVVSNQTCTNRFILTRTYRAVDACGNSATCNQTITVFDNTAPVINCPPNTTVQCANQVPTSTNFFGQGGTASDNCVSSSVQFVGDLISGQTCSNRFTITRTYRAIDDCGNSATCNQTITVFDNTAPPISCPANTTVQCANQVPAPNGPTAGATDNCGGVSTIAFVADVISNQTCANRFTVTRTYRATDECGNSATCNQTITVFDDTAPPITCPSNTTVQCANQVPTPNGPTAGATDNCGGVSTVTFVNDVISNQTCANRFTVTRTYRATDECGNSATCNQTITVFDNTAPPITCPQNTTVQCASQVPAPNGPTAGATDNCGGVSTVTFVADAITGMTCANRFTVTRTYRATDECGNSATCNQTITVFDNTAPSITCPQNLTIECTANTLPGGANGTATGTDNCTPTSSEVWINEFHYDNTGADVGEFIELAGPAGTDLSIYTLVRYNGNGGAVYTTPAGPTITGIIPNQSNGFGTLAFTYPLDGLQNGAPDGFALVKNGTTVIQFLSYEGVFVAVGGPANGMLSTDVIVQELGSEPLGFSINLIGIGNTYSNFFWFGPSTQSPGAFNAGQSIPPPISGPVITSNDITIAGACPQEYTINRTWRATDACGNSSTCLQTIFVDDSTNPSITCPVNVSVQCASQVPPFSVASVSASDNCTGVPTVTFVGDVTSNQTCTNRFTLTRTYRATDACGNSSTCSQTITVFDNTVPSITCPANLTVQCASQVPANNPATVSSSDNCGGTASVTFVNDVITNQTCTNRFLVNRTYRATDACGNAATCTQTITVFDNTAPTLTCPAGLTVQCANQVPANNPALVTTSDNCGGTASVTFVGDVISGQTCANRFTLTRTYRATDACGNSATCSQTITVFDNTPPPITNCPANLTVQCASQVPAPNGPTPGATDNCGGVSTVTFVSDVISNQTCINRFTLTRTYRVADECGNSTTCNQIITVFDNTPPTITVNDPAFTGVPNGGRVDIQCFGQDPNWDLPEFSASSATGSDNCTGNVTITFTQVLLDQGNCIGDGYIVLYRLTWTATDACGNSSSRFYNLALVDHTPPVIHNLPADITVNCDEIPAQPSDVYATDECLCACIILFNETTPAPGCQNGQVVSRSWTARDDCGNQTVATQKITLIDNKGPELIMMVPQLQGVEDGAILNYTCNEGGIPHFFDNLSAESVFSPVSCGTSGMISFNKNIIFSNNCKFWGYIEERTYHWHGIDKCGNETDLTIIVRLVDTEAPVLINVPELTCVDDPLLKKVDAIDNCGNPFFRFWDTPIQSPCGSGPAWRRTYEAWDDCGNFSRDTAILIGNDLTHPNITFVNPILADLEFGETLIVECGSYDGHYTPFGPDDVHVENSCSVGLTVHFHENIIESGNCTNGVVAVLDLEWAATDVCGNLTVETIRANVVDHTRPVLLNFAPDVTIGCRDSIPAIQATDNCGDVTLNIEETVIQGSCPYEYDVQRHITATDPCGNQTAVLQNVHVGNGNGPTIEGVVKDVCDDLSIPNVTAFDPCAGEFVPVTMTQDTLDTNCDDGIVIERIWSAVDACGHVTEIKQRIVVGDHTPPVIKIPTNSIILDFLDAVGKNLVYLSQTEIVDKLNALNDNSVIVFDDCDQQITPVFTVEITYAANCQEDGYFEHRVYTWVATDVCGNSTSLSFNVDIMDDVPPVLLGVPEDASYICQQLPAPPTVTSDDPAQPVTIVYSQQIVPGDGPGEFIVHRKWVGTDACGNVTVAVQTIIWIPNTLLECEIILPDQVECNSHGVLIGSNVTGGLGPITYNWEVVGEKCFIQSGQGTPEILIYIGWTQVEIILTVTDAYGCSTVCSATLNCVIGTGNPLIGTTPTLNSEIVNGSDKKVVENADISLPEGYLTKLNLWPNPANGSVNLSFDSYINHEIQFSLTNMLGQVVLTENFNALKGSNTHTVDVSRIHEGSYMMQVKSEREMYSKVVVILRNN